ncbi:13140_t:CDS:1, partial [Acaulospora colombiana]
AAGNRILLNHEVNNTRPVGDWISHLPQGSLGSVAEDRRTQALYPFNQSAGDLWTASPSFWSSHQAEHSQASAYLGVNTGVVDSLSRTSGVQSLAHLNPLASHRSNSFSSINPSPSRGTSKHTPGSASVNAYPKAWPQSYDSAPWPTAPGLSSNEENETFGLVDTGYLGMNKEVGTARSNTITDPSFSSSDAPSMELLSGQSITSSLGRQSSEPRLAEEDEVSADTDIQERD